jgi:hypothetical protein
MEASFNQLQQVFILGSRWMIAMKMETVQKSMASHLMW